ncbi:hypothetical protein SDRG_08515 [Saprolegnia diclina VS20]|uniref:FYVE-type domain-containing protein n=1 Tax=Saprolegnia diclina (strain VS20) TaxID=1156394 RepID=T0RNA2_SAPDV|nr:hypothetical protein SDRG_08515 [Saprolegnia diclina VS20]EQC33833.1 hypothetical protein SDRG_08515 [Saprolegnia diclina VS20]|eukprot:XP_008612628.1 hypothetical protein SDRG_08515 [Saprolegnia diclina VS20]
MNHKRYPVPAAIFPCPPLSATESATYVKLGHDTLDKFLDAVLSNDASVRWSPLGEVDNVHVYEGEMPGLKLDRHTLPYRAIGRVQATLGEVAGLHNFDTRDKCLDYIYEYAGDIMDMIPLYTLASSDDGLHRIYLKWVACATPVPVVRDRDFVFLETQDTFERDGRRGWAFCQYSVDLACCPSLKETEMNLVRGTLNYTGAVFLETDEPGVLDVIYHVATNFKGHIPVLLRKIHIRHRAARKILSIQDYVQRRRYHNSGATSGEASPTDMSRCAVCAHSSTRFQRLHACHGCHLPVCPHCSRKWSRRGASSVRVCQLCSAGARQGLISSMRGTSSTRTISSSSSSSVSSGVGSPRLTVVGRSTEMDLSYLSLYRNIPEEGAGGVSPISSSCVMPLDVGAWDDDDDVVSATMRSEADLTTSDAHVGFRDVLSRLTSKLARVH